MIHAVQWKSDYLEMLDQTQLPETALCLRLQTIEEVFEAIQSLRVRGAPAIGITAAYGLYLGLRQNSFLTARQFFQALDEKIQHLASARPTAVNLFWAMEQLKSQLARESNQDPAFLTKRLLELAIALHEDDRHRCHQMAEHGQQIVPSGARILTHCNTGALATGGIGTAFGVIFKAHQIGKNIKVYANETRPVLQGARLTMYELSAAGIPSQLVCDSTAATLMRQGMVDLVIVGADRIAADGSVANKIGTYMVAICAKHHGLPFYVAAPLSTVDLSIATGSKIPIETRNEEEVRRVFGKTLITPPSARCWNPAFDVTPPDLIAGIITENGIARPPFQQSLPALAAPLNRE